MIFQILKLYGHNTVMVNGSMEPAERDKSVKAFQAPGGPSVMLLSDVGAQGLNLQRASILVFVVSGYLDLSTRYFIHLCALLFILAWSYVACGT